MTNRLDDADATVARLRGDLAKMDVRIEVARDVAGKCRQQVARARAAVRDNRVQAALQGKKGGTPSTLANKQSAAESELKQANDALSDVLEARSWLEQAVRDAVDARQGIVVERGETLRGDFPKLLKTWTRDTARLLECLRRTELGCVASLDCDKWVRQLAGTCSNERHIHFRPGVLEQELEAAVEYWNDRESKL